MASEFWQRLREARKFANKTQMQAAKALGISRSGYAFYENDDPEQRTQPNVEQIVTLSQLYKVPAEWLLNDKAEVSDLWKGTTGQRTAEPQPAPYAPAPALNQDRAQQRFWAATEYILTSKDFTKDGAFGRQVRAGALELDADYLWENTLAVFSRNSGDAEVLQTVGYLFVLSKAARMREPRLILLLRSDTPPSEGVVESVRRFLGVQVSWVQTPEEAAAALQ